MPLTLGLTGTIGSGKTTVARLLHEIGDSRWGAGSVDVIDADQLAREAVKPGTPALAEIEREFGIEVIKADGALDRRKLAQIVFADRSALKRLNAIVHPRVREAEVARINEAKGRKLIVLDVPLLFETGMQELMDKTMVVVVNEAMRFARLRQRGLAEREVIARLGSQWPQAEKKRLADITIDNSGTLEATRTQLETWLTNWQTEGLL